MSVVVVNYDGTKFEINRTPDIDLTSISGLVTNHDIGSIIDTIRLNPTKNKTFLVKIEKSSGDCSTGFLIGSNCFTINNVFTYDTGKTASLKILNEDFLNTGSSSSSSSSTSSSSTSSTAAPVLKSDLLTEFYSKLIEMGFDDSKASELFTKYDKDINEKEDVPKIFDEIFKNGENIVEKPIEPFINNNGHGPNGLRQVSGTDCFISSAIHLMKDIESYVPREYDDIIKECYQNPEQTLELNKLHRINSSTGTMYEYIDGTTTDNEYVNSSTELYTDLYTKLRTYLVGNPGGFGDPVDCLSQYIKIVNCEKEIIQMAYLMDENTVNENTNEIQKEADIDSDGKLTENIINEYTADYLILNRALLYDTTNRDAWTDIIFPPELGDYTLVGKILHPLGHYVYVSYIDPQNPILYNDGEVSEFKVRDGVKYYDDQHKNEPKFIPNIKDEWTDETYAEKSKEYQKQKNEFLQKQNLVEPTYTESLFLRQDRLVTSCLYKKKSTGKV
jgi:hypothetical protein